MMAATEYTYLVIENAPDVCEGIIRRMSKFPNWKSLGYCVGVKEALKEITIQKPDLLFLDWSLNGGSAFEILQQVQNVSSYNPYIIFNTGFQKDNPEIPQEIINRYKVDKYLVKPLWENLRIHLPQYLHEAAEKKTQDSNKNSLLWLDDIDKNKIRIDMDKITCICQHPLQPRCRNIFIFNAADEITVPLQWHKLYALLRDYKIDFFITKSRAHLVVKKYVEKFERPFIRIKGLNAFKIDIVKENIRDFETWLLK